MPHQQPKELTSPDLETRLKAWRELGGKGIKGLKIGDLCSALRVEQDAKVRAQGILSLLEAEPWVSDPMEPDSLEKWFFEPFLPSERKSRRSGVVAICDRQHIRDVQSLVNLGRFFSSQQFPDTAFHHIPLANPNWGPIGLHNLNALCFIGRPSMFKDCDIIGQLEKQKAGARFGFPPDEDRWRGAKLDDDSADAFHHVLQRRPLIEPHPWKAHEDKSKGRRTDYAVVQRFRINYGGKPLWVFVLAGATSLGTFAAAEWAISSSFPDILRNAFLRAGLDADESTEMEVLLEVSAVVNEPAQPWVVEFCKPKKLFLNGGVNVLSAPNEITLCNRGGSVRCVLFDEDEVSFGERAQAALIALCRKSIAKSSAVVGLQELISDASVWPRGLTTVDMDKAKGFFNDNLRRHRMREALSIDGESLVLHCKVQEREV